MQFEPIFFRFFGNFYERSRRSRSILQLRSGQDFGGQSKESKILQKTTNGLIDVAENLGGTFYLPYQLYYSEKQLHKAYPEIDGVFATKMRYDPTELFSNKFYEKYARSTYDISN